MKINGLPALNEGGDREVTGTILVRFFAELLLFEKKVVYLQRQMDNKYLYNQYAQLCSIQKKLKT